jgi:hypothetical protein
MAISRREFLKTGVLGLAAGVTLLATDTAFAQRASVAPMPAAPEHAGIQAGGEHVPGYLKRATYEKLLNSNFQIRPTGAAAMRLRLVAATDEARESGVGQPADPGGECFSLIFRGSAKAPLKQDTYTLSHPRMGRFRLFLVPVRKDADGISYQALINREYA